MPYWALALVLIGFVAAAGSVLVRLPPWEAADEPSHVGNVESLARGNWYRIERGMEGHQPPLYYLGLAGWQRILHVEVHTPAPVGCPLEDKCGFLYRHDTGREGGDRRLVRTLRLPSVFLGLLTLILTAMAARRLSRDRWTPVVAAAFVGSVPGFVVFSGVVNNDNLAPTMGAVLVLGALRYRRAPTVGMAVVVGAVLGLLVLTKLPAPFIALGVLVAIVTAPVSRREQFDHAAVMMGIGAMVCGAWLVWNQVNYGDPLGAQVAHDWLAPRLGLGVPRHYGTAHILALDVPRGLWRTLFTDRHHGELLGIVAFVPLLLLARRRLNAGQQRNVAVLVGVVVGAVVGLCLVALNTATWRTSVLYVGLPALGCLVALGLERWRVAARFIPPVLGAIVTVLIVTGPALEFFARPLNR